jgi:putative ABC transport system permease protein
MPGQINVIDANLGSVDPARREEIQRDIESVLGPGFKVGAISAATEILSNLRFGVLMINLVGVLALLMGAFIIFNTFRTVVAERRRDIGMLRAVGASRRRLGVPAEGAIQGWDFLRLAARLRPAVSFCGMSTFIGFLNVIDPEGLAVCRSFSGVGSPLWAGFLVGLRITPLGLASLLPP